MKKTAFTTIVSIIILFVLSSITFAADINGMIGVVIGSGDIKYGAKINVFLTTKAIRVIPVIAKTDGTARQIETTYNYDTIVSLGDAWEKVNKEMKSNPDYIKSKTMTSLAGKFKFANIEPGKYYVVVTFPSTVAMNQVFWQVPIEIDKKDVDIELSNDNFTIPPYLSR